MGWGIRGGMEDEAGYTKEPFGETGTELRRKTKGPKKELLPRIEKMVVRKPKMHIRRCHQNLHYGKRKSLSGFKGELAEEKRSGRKRKPGGLLKKRTC